MKVQQVQYVTPDDVNLTFAHPPVSVAAETYVVMIESMTSTRDKEKRITLPALSRSRMLDLRSRGS